jgi:PhzF family phenazine biosynthesis protein
MRALEKAVAQGSTGNRVLDAIKAQPGFEQALAAALGLETDDLLWRPAAVRPLWLDSGSEQLLVPLTNAEAVRRAAPRIDHFGGIVSAQGRRMAYVFAEDGPGMVCARFFFAADGAFREDPATGSACANLGGWYRATGVPGLLQRRVFQGDQVRRPSTLDLRLAAAGEVFVTGEVVHLGCGTLNL